MHTFVYEEEMRENFKIESHLKRVRWYWQETEVPTGKEQRNKKKCENRKPLKPCSVVLA